jgi:hypothetical protein
MSVIFTLTGVCACSCIQGSNGEVQPDVWSQLSRLLHDSCAERSPRRSRSSGGGSLCFQLSDRGSAGESAEIQRLILATQHFWQ